MVVLAVAGIAINMEAHQMLAITLNQTTLIVMMVAKAKNRRPRHRTQSHISHGAGTGMRATIFPVSFSIFLYFISVIFPKFL